MEITTDGRARKEMEQRLAALQTSLNAVKNSITKFENLIEDCRMVEEELHRIEEDEAHQEEEDEAHQEEEETADVKMVDEEERGNPESSGPRMEADTEDIPSLVSGGDTVSWRRRSSWVKHPNLRIRQLDLTAPGVRPPQSQEGWQSYISHPQAALGLRRERPHRSLLSSNEL